MFEQDSALAHQACKIVAFLDRETSNFMFPCCLVLRRFFFQAEDGIRDLVRSRGLGDVYKRQLSNMGT